jgi:hypothetical protein
VRILYGVAGEGMGHATRSHAFLADLAPPPEEAPQRDRHSREWPLGRSPK